MDKAESKKQALKLAVKAIVLIVIGVLGYIICNGYKTGIIQDISEDEHKGTSEDSYSITVDDAEFDAISLKAVSLQEREKAKDGIDINTAIPDVFMFFDGIGPTKADAIIRMRYEIGGFKCIEDIQNVSGISKKTYDKIKDRIYAAEIDEELLSRIETVDAGFIRLMDIENAEKEFEKEWNSMLD